MIEMALFGIVGVLIAVIAFFQGVTVLSDARSAIHQIYGALFLLIATTGVVLAAIAVGFTEIRSALRAERVGLSIDAAPALPGSWLQRCIVAAILVVALITVVSFIRGYDPR